MTEYIKVCLMNLPYTIKGLTIKVDADGYIILINARLNDEQQRNTYDHEILHINNNDFDHFYDVSILEELRHAV